MVAVDPFDLTTDQLRQLLPPLPLPLLLSAAAALPELDALHCAPGLTVALNATAHLLSDLDAIPQTTYTWYRRFADTGDRGAYEAPYTLKRQRLSAAALRMLLGEDRYWDAVHDYLWAICDEAEWVVPAHAGRAIDLYAADTGLILAETLVWLGDRLDGDVRHRVRQAIEARIFDRYFRFGFDHRWHQSHDNWNAVCNSTVAATFLLLEPEPQRRAAAVRRALDGLRVYLDTAFASDGSTSEGVKYWHYGVSGFVVFAEMLRACSGGAIDLLDSDRVRQIAAYPAKLCLPGGLFASFADSPERVAFNPGIVTRLAERAAVPALYTLLVPPPEPESHGLPSLLRFILWQTDTPLASPAPPAPPALPDATLPDAGIVRLVASTAAGFPVAFMVKAGNNGENHNHNDIGSFILSVDGENLLADPGPGRYDRDYFGDRRYESVFANSYGHSVPRIGGQRQGTGEAFVGALVTIETDGPMKRAVLDFARAYPVPNLIRATRQITLATAGTAARTVWLEDDFAFAAESALDTEIEEALVTWETVHLDGGDATVEGRRHRLHLHIEAPAGVAFTAERLADHDPQTDAPATLTRLRFVLPSGERRARIRMEILPRLVLDAP